MRQLQKVANAAFTDNKVLETKTDRTKKSCKHSCADLLYPFDTVSMFVLECILRRYLNLSLTIANFSFETNVSRGGELVTFQIFTSYP